MACWRKIPRIFTGANGRKRQHLSGGRSAAIPSLELKQGVFSPGLRPLTGTAYTTQFKGGAASCGGACSANRTRFAGCSIQIRIAVDIQSKGKVGDGRGSVETASEVVDHVFDEAVSARLEFENDSAARCQERACWTAGLGGPEDVSGGVKSQCCIWVGAVRASEGMKEILAPGVPVKRQTEDDSKVRSAPGRGSPPEIAGSVADHACSWVGAVAAIEGDEHGFDAGGLERKDCTQAVRASSESRSKESSRSVAREAGQRVRPVVASKGVKDGFAELRRPESV
jgi:hypothetical protein